MGNSKFGGVDKRMFVLLLHRYLFGKDEKKRERKIVKLEVLR
jgi:hypothetical protein